MSAQPVPTALASPSGASSPVAADLTRVENELRLYTQILENITEGVVLARIDDGRIVYSNPRLSAMYGYEVGELVGRPVSILASLDGADPHETILNLRKELAIRSEWIGQIRTVRTARKDGRSLWTELRVSTFEHPEHGKVWCGVHQDVTQQRAAIEALNKIDERRLYTLERLSPVGIFRTDAAGRCTYVNYTWLELAGLSEEQTLGEGWAEAVHPGDRKRVLRMWARSVRAQAPFRAEYRLRRSARGTSWVLAQALPETDRDEGLVGYIGTVTDISERRRAESVLRRAQRALRESEARYRGAAVARETLLREVHHRVKNNLQVVASLLMLQLGHVRDEPVRTLVEESRARIDAIALLHEKLCQSDDLTQVDLGSYVAKVVDGVRASFGGHTRQIDFDIEAERLLVVSDTALHCGLIVNELVSNALKHAFPEGRVGRVAVTLTRPAPNQAALSIEDDGVGMDPEITLESVGTLGLQLVRHLTDQLGGQLAIERKDGTRFTLTFDVPSKLANAAAARTAIPPASG